MLKALPTSALSLARVIGNSPDCVKLLDTEGQLVWMNENGLCAMEIDSFDMVARQQWASLWPTDQQDRITQSLSAALTEGNSNFTAPCPTARGNARWWDVAVHPVDDETGKHVGYLSISRDVTERETQRIALETVIAEMRHRLKNSYAMVCSLMNGLARGDAGHMAFAHDVQQRVSALAEAQSLFAEDRHETGLHYLLATIMAPFDAQAGCRVSIDADQRIMIEKRTADCVALAIGEFAVNAAKYGASVHGGEIAISGVISDDLLVLRWSEQSLAKVAGTHRDGGQGLAIIQRMLAVNGATFHMDWHDNGPHAEIHFKRGFSLRTDD